MAINYDLPINKILINDREVPLDGIKPAGDIELTSNGSHDVTEYATAIVSVTPNLQEKTARENGNVLPDTGYDGLSKVIVDVDEPVLITKTITSNGTYKATDESADGYSIVEVSTPVGGEVDLTDYAGALMNAGGSFSDPYNIMSACGSYAFYFTQLTNVSLPVCTYIGSYAFRYASYLTSVNCPEVSVLYTAAFADCSSLATISFPKCTNVGAQAFSGCRNITSIDFPQCKTVQTSAFYACRNNTTISIPLCTTVYSYGFGYNDKATTLYAPNLQTVGSSAFASCSALLSIDLPKCTIIHNDGFANCSVVSTANIPLCSSVGRYAFDRCYALQSITATALERVGDNAFRSCRSLTRVDWSKCSYVGSTAFMNCSALTEISLPLLSSTGNSAFTLCSSLSKATFTSTNVQLGNWAFMGCSSLKEFVCPGLFAVPYYCFSGCINLSSISLDVAWRLDSSAFYDCSALETLVIGGSSCQLVNVNAFYNTPMSNSTYIGRFGSIYVPDEYVQSYKTSGAWATYADRIVGISTLNPPTGPNGTYTTTSTDSAYHSLLSFDVNDSTVSNMAAGSNYDRSGLIMISNANYADNKITLTYEYSFGGALGTTELTYDAASNSFSGQIYQLDNRDNATLVSVSFVQ